MKIDPIVAGVGHELTPDNPFQNRLQAAVNEVFPGYDDQTVTGYNLECQKAWGEPNMVTTITIRLTGPATPWAVTIPSEVNPS